METLLSACVVSAAFMSASAEATTISGYLDDVGNSALISSNGFGDLEAARFGSADVVARNLAIYSLDILSLATFEFRSSGYAAGGAQPYLSIFSGSTTAATFVDSNYFDPDIDFDVTESLGAGNYLVAIGVYENESFAENLGTGTVADGFTALGVPDYVGAAFYQLDVTSSATFLIAPAPVLGAGGQPPPSTDVPEPTDLALVAIGGLSMIVMRQRRSVALRGYPAFTAGEHSRSSEHLFST